MTASEIHYLEEYYSYFYTEHENSCLKSQKQEALYNTTKQRDNLTKQVEELEKSQEVEMTQSKTEMYNLLSALFQEHENVLLKLSNDSFNVIDIHFQFLGKKYSIYNLSLPKSRNSNQSFIENYADKFINNYHEMNYSTEFKKLISILTLVENNPQTKSIIVDHQIKKVNSDTLNKLEQLNQDKIATEELIENLTSTAISSRQNKHITELKAKLEQLDNQIEVENNSLHSESIKDDISKIVDQSLKNLRAIVDFTEKIQRIQVKLRENDDRILRESQHISRLSRLIEDYQKDIEKLNSEIFDNQKKVNYFLEKNYYEPILIKALKNANESELPTSIYNALPTMQERYSNFLNDKVNELLD